LARPFSQAWRQLTARIKLPLVSWRLAMSSTDLAYHRQREQQCRSMAETASNPEVRRRHEALADLHACKIAMSAAA
jgi:hypothetical protein